MKTFTLLTPLSIKRTFTIPAVAAFLSMASASAPGQTIISVDFYGNSTTLLDPGDVAGVGSYAAANWNLVTGGTSTTPVALNTSTGAASGVVLASTDVKFGGGGLASLGTEPETGDQKLYDGNINADIWFGQPAISFTIEGLEAFSSYQLVVYYSGMAFSDNSRRGALSTSADGSLTYYHIIQNTGEPQPGSPEPTYVQVTSTDELNPMKGNYAIFSGLTDDSLTVNYVALNNVTGLTGFQIIGIPVPEPQAGLLGCLTLGVLFLRRRRDGQPNA